MNIDTASRFGYQWRKYATIYPRQEEQFLNWIHPFVKEDFAGKDICDAGCGMGRNTYWLTKYGAKSIVAFDYAEAAVESARALLENFPDVRVERINIYDIDYPERFDVCLSIGVIHHLEHPRRAIERLVRSLRAGGKLIVWLYGYEGNERYVKLFRVIHPLLKKISPASLEMAAYVFSLPLYFWLSLGGGKSPYLKKISRLSYRYFHLMILDQLVPEIARYYRKKEVEELFSGTGLSDVQIYHNLNYSWTVIGTK